MKIKKGFNMGLLRRGDKECGRRTSVREEPGSAAGMDGMMAW